MWNLYSFFNPEKNLAIHCDTIEKAKLVTDAFCAYGRRWHSGDSYTDTKYPIIHDEDSINYTNDGCYGYDGALPPEYTIIPFEEICLKVIPSETINHYKAIIDKGQRILSFSKSPRLYLAYPRTLLAVIRDALTCDETLWINVYQDASTRKFHSFPYNIDTFTAVLYDIHSRDYLLVELA